MNKRTNYMSRADLHQDMATKQLISLVTKYTLLKDQLLVIKELEKRNELPEEQFFELLEKCNGE